MRELGAFEEKEHRQLGLLVSQSADHIYLLGPAMHTYMADELEKVGYNMEHVTLCDDSLELAEHLATDIPAMEDRSVVLFKASQNTLYIEEAIKSLLKQ